MEAHKKKLVIAGSLIGGLIIVGAAIFLGIKRKKLQAKLKSGSTDVVIPAKATVSAVLFPLKRGSGVTTAENDAVRVVQRYINAKSLEHWWFGITTLKEDGIFGSLTEAALYKLSGVKEVSYTLYKTMDDYIAISLLDSSYLLNRTDNTDPNVAKNDIISMIW